MKKLLLLFICAALCLPGEMVGTKGGGRKSGARTPAPEAKARHWAAVAPAPEAKAPAAPAPRTEVAAPAPTPSSAAAVPEAVPEAVTPVEAAAPESMTYDEALAALERLPLATTPYSELQKAYKLTDEAFPHLSKQAKAEKQIAAPNSQHLMLMSTFYGFEKYNKTAFSNLETLAEKEPTKENVGAFNAQATKIRTYFTDQMTALGKKLVFQRHGLGKIGFVEEQLAKLDQIEKEFAKKAGEKSTAAPAAAPSASASSASASSSATPPSSVSASSASSAAAATPPPSSAAAPAPTPSSAAAVPAAVTPASSASSSGPEPSFSAGGPAPSAPRSAEVAAPAAPAAVAEKTEEEKKVDELCKTFENYVNECLKPENAAEKGITVELMRLLDRTSTLKNQLSEDKYDKAKTCSQYEHVRYDAWYDAVYAKKYVEKACKELKDAADKCLNLDTETSSVGNMKTAFDNFSETVRSFQYEKNEKIKECLNIQANRVEPWRKIYAEAATTSPSRAAAASSSSSASSGGVPAPRPEVAAPPLSARSLLRSHSSSAPARPSREEEAEKTQKIERLVSTFSNVVHDSSPFMTTDALTERLQTLERIYTSTKSQLTELNAALNERDTELYTRKVEEVQNQLTALKESVEREKEEKTREKAAPAPSSAAAPVVRFSAEDQKQLDALKRNIAASHDAIVKKVYQDERDVILIKAGAPLESEAAVAGKLSASDKESIAAAKTSIKETPSTAAQKALLKQIYGLIDAAAKR